MAVQLTKAGIFHTFGALPWENIVQGATVGASLMAGSWLARTFVQRIEPARFNALLDGLMVAVGLLLLSGVLT